MKKTSNLLRDRYLWYTAIILAIVAILTYVFEQDILGILANSNQSLQVFMTIRNFLLLGTVILSSWRFGFKGGVVTSVIIALLLLPHILTETFSEANNSESLLEYVIFVPFGIVFSWLIGAQRQIEKRLADSEVQYRRLFETAQDAILILNGETGQIIDANPFVKDLLGVPFEELKGKNLWDIGEFKDTLASKISYKELNESGFKRWNNLPLVTKDGRVISVEVVANAYQADHTRVIQCNIRDITVADLAVKTLREVKKDLEVAQHLTGIGSWKWIISTDKITWSEELRHIIGLDPNLPVPPFAEMERFYTPNSWKRLNEAVTMAFNTGEPYELEVAEIRTDGTIINTITRGEADIDENGKIISLHGTVQDVTEQRRSERETATILRTTMDGFYIVDTQGRILDTNYAYCSMIGYSRDELLHMRVADIEAVDTDEVIKQRIQQIMGTGSARFETKHKCKDGRIIDIEASVNYLGGSESKLFCFVRDITERKKAQQTLELQASLLDAELDSVYLLDLEGHILYANKVASSCYGYTKEELLNMNISQLDDPESANLIAPRIKEILAKGHGTFNINHRRKDGSLIPMDIHTSLVESDDKQFLLSVAHDTTERRQLQEQLMAQDRLASIGQLVSGVAHEINNPLTSVIGFSDLLLQRELPDDVKADLKIVNDEAKRTALIVKNLLSFARKQPEGKVPVDINEQLQRVVALRIHEEKINNIQVNLNLASDLPRITGNASQLQQVFFNIITNAEQAMLEAHNNGTLTITSKQVDDIVKVSFVDDGPGISPENMRKLFTPFFTTKGVGKGTGLGLSICHGIVNEHGGKIYAESVLGKGATFIVELPVKQATAAKEVAEMKSSDDPTQHK